MDIVENAHRQPQALPGSKTLNVWCMQYTVYRVPVDKAVYYSQGKYHEV